MSEFATLGGLRYVANLRGRPFARMVFDHSPGYAWCMNQWTHSRTATRSISKSWRAGQDTAFRQALVADPRGTIDREFGVQLPSNLALRVVEENPTTRYMVLPPANTPGSLSDTDLEEVAGGGRIMVSFTPGCNEV